MRGSASAAKIAAKAPALRMRPRRRPEERHSQDAQAMGMSTSNRVQGLSKLITAPPHVPRLVSELIGHAPAFLGGNGQTAAIRQAVLRPRPAPATATHRPPPEPAAERAESPDGRPPAAAISFLPLPATSAS